MLYRNSEISLRDVNDGTSNTFMVGELSWDHAVGRTAPDHPRGPYDSWISGEAGTWTTTWHTVYRPLNSTPYHLPDGSEGVLNEVSFGSNPPGGAMFLMADASVQFISETINHATYLAAASRDGGEALMLP